ncbi:DUF2617 family protein [Candidatus Pacearchaeota archaeon]|nr:DUF2617 family protein [Candidatus Pacearchaeota archaeon]
MVTQKYQDQSADDLRLTVLAGELDVSQFSVMSEQTITSSHLGIHAAIIGASHFVEVQWDDIRINEVFACTEVSSNGPKAHYGPLNLVVGGVALKFANRVKYIFNAEAWQWAQGANKLSQLLNKIKGGSITNNNIGLTFQFPGGDIKKPPITIFWLEILPHKTSQQINIETIHAYPNEDRIVYTQSSIISGGDLCTS